MKILILGGTGAMGVPLARLLADKNNKVYVTSRQKLNNSDNIKYINGNAHDKEFLNDIINNGKYTAIVDFMSYSENEFRDRIDLILNSTDRYIFLSSARVFANEECPIKENSPRLLDVCSDKEYLSTNEYALDKAREENILFSHKKKNWTIIRPYITYNSERMQLGVLEKESWLFRALNGKKIVFSKDIAQMFTTLTYGNDVAECISAVLSSDLTCGKAFNCVSNEKIKWNDVLEIYLDSIEKYTGKRPEVFFTDNFEFANVYYQLIYDRLFNRIFDNTEITTIAEKSDFIPAKNGLDKCIADFLSGNRKFRYINWRLEGSMDKITGEKTSIFKIQGWKNKVKYFLYRYIV